MMNIKRNLRAEHGNSLKQTQFSKNDEFGEVILWKKKSSIFDSVKTK